MKLGVRIDNPDTGKSEIVIRHYTNIGQLKIISFSRWDWLHNIWRSIKIKLMGEKESIPITKRKHNETK